MYNSLCLPSEDVDATAPSDVGVDLRSLVDGSSFDFLLIDFPFFLFPEEKDLESGFRDGGGGCCFAGSDGGSVA